MSTMVHVLHALTVHFDCDDSLVVATVGLDLCSTAVGAVVRWRDVDDLQASFGLSDPRTLSTQHGRPVPVIRGPYHHNMANMSPCGPYHHNMANTSPWFVDQTITTW